MLGFLASLRVWVTDVFMIAGRVGFQWVGFHCLYTVPSWVARSCERDVSVRRVRGGVLPKPTGPGWVHVVLGMFE